MKSVAKSCYFRLCSMKDKSGESHQRQRLKTEHMNEKWRIGFCCGTCLQILHAQFNTFFHSVKLTIGIGCKLN